MFNHDGPPQISAFPGIGPSNGREDARACNHVGTAMVANHLESIRGGGGEGRRLREPMNSITQSSQAFSLPLPFYRREIVLERRAASQGTLR